METSTFTLLFYWDLYPHVHLHHSCTCISLRKVIMPCFPRCNYAPHVRLHRICASVTLRKVIMPCFPRCNYAPHVRLRRIGTSVTLRKVIMPCFPQCNCADANFKGKQCPELDGSRARPAPQPRRILCAQRLTPLPFATPCIQIHCENTRIRALPHFPTCTLSHAAHTNCNL